jgi:hypothetical protein
MLVYLIQEKVDGLMNVELCKDFTDEEIDDALFQIGPLKAAGVDGFPGRFYQHNWATLKIEVTNDVKLFFLTGHMPDGINNTSIVLIPKNSEAETLRYF